MRPIQADQKKHAIGAATAAPGTPQAGPDRRRPKVLVLLASYNGEKWIRDQLTSILEQEGVDVTVAVRDDGSSDATRGVVGAFSADPRVSLVSGRDRTGSAAQNFFALIRGNTAEGVDFVAFSDQDDFWLPTKLATAGKILSESRTFGYSSATIATWPDGRAVTLRQPTATSADFLFEGGGQGCTFVLHRDFYLRVRQFFLQHSAITQRLHYHDWAIYALARAWELGWAFDQTPTVVYRQHADNDTGARGTAAGARKRLALIRSGWYGAQLNAIAELCAAAAPSSPLIAKWSSIALSRGGVARRLQIAGYCLGHGRRRWRDNAVLILAGLIGWV